MAASLCSASRLGLRKKKATNPRTGTKTTPEPRTGLDAFVRVPGVLCAPSECEAREGGLNVAAVGAINLDACADACLEDTACVSFEALSEKDGSLTCAIHHQGRVGAALVGGRFLEGAGEYYELERVACSDQRQNGDELGVDCGGSCVRQCSIENAVFYPDFVPPPLQFLEASTFPGLAMVDTM